MTIGQLAKRAGVHVETIRYYEKRGLLEAPPRTESGYRQYAEDAVRRLRFIKRAQKLGFSLREIQELLALRLDPRTTCADIRHRAEVKIADIDHKIAALHQIRQALQHMVLSCQQGSMPISACPILDALEGLSEIPEEAP